MMVITMTNSDIKYQIELLDYLVKLLEEYPIKGHEAKQLVKVLDLLNQYKSNLTEEVKDE